MAKKKKVKRVSGGKIPRKVSKKPSRTKSTLNNQLKMRVALKNLILFLILFFISLIVYNSTQPGLLNNLFWLAALITVFIAVAFFIALLVFLFLKPMIR